MLCANGSAGGSSFLDGCVGPVWMRRLGSGNGGVIPVAVAPWGAGGGGGCQVEGGEKELLPIVIAGAVWGPGCGGRLG